MESIDPVEVLFFILRTVPVILVLIFIWSMIPSQVNIIRENEIGQFGNELAENMLAGMSVYKDVLDVSALDRLNNKYDEPLRNCKYAYHAYVKDLASGKSWSFGYDKPETNGIIQKQASKVFPAGVYIPSENKIEPAQLTLELYETWMSRITCLIETAYYTGEKQEMKLSCIPFHYLGGEKCFFEIGTEPATGTQIVHVGVYVGEGKMVDAKGTALGVVEEKLEVTDNFEGCYPASIVQAIQNKIVDNAKLLEGKQYVWGAESLEEGGFDCSGLVYRVLNDAGLIVERTTADGYYIKFKSNRIQADAKNPSSWQSGDLCFFKPSSSSVLYASNSVEHITAGGSETLPREEKSDFRKINPNINLKIDINSIKEGIKEFSKDEKKKMIAEPLGNTVTLKMEDV